MNNRFLFDFEKPENQVIFIKMFYTLTIIIKKRGKISLKD